ncbi:MAG: hypothetical protein ACOCXI_04370 [Chloroflexota bacterium]
MSNRHSARLLLILLLLIGLSACGVLEVDLEASPEPGIGGEEPTPAETDVAQPTPPPTEEATEEPAPSATATQPAEATDEAAPADTPAPQPEMLRVVFSRENNAYLWTPGAGEQPLTDSGDVEGANISDDGQRVALIRDGHLWVVNGDGSDERQLTRDEDFAGMDLDDVASNIVGVRVYQTEWIPGTHSLLFNTNPQLEGPGLLLSNDLWRVDVDSGELTQLRSVGEGGNFTLSPDGSQLALVRPDNVSVMNLDGSNVRDLLSYTPVLTYSEYQYYAQPVWMPDGSALRVAIPPSDPMAQPAQATEIWHLPVDGGSPNLMGQVMAFMPQNQANVVLAPDGSRLAYLEESEAGGGARNLMLATLNDQVGESTMYAESVNEIRGWSPDAARLVFARHSGNTMSLSLGAPPAAPQNVGGGQSPVIALEWADDEQFVFTQQSGEGWDLILGNIAGETQTIATIAGQPPAFDVDK